MDSNTTRTRTISSGAKDRVALLDCVVLAIASLISYLLVTSILSRVYFLSRADDLIGGLWAVLATVFTFRETYEQSMTAAVSGA
jgi:hypothetical protein